ncbi:MAG: septum formation initiator family protein [Candidatus Gottesmanbacteria bacterium]
MKQKPIAHLMPLLALVGLCIAIVSLITSLTSTTRRRTILQTRQTELTKLQEKNQELEKKLQLVQSPEFIETEARDKLNLAKTGETIILIDQTTKENGNKQTSTTQIANWKKWWSLFF